jgi:D-threo-aldose 1-dehydrogenase
VARQRNVKFVIGSSLNAGFISGSPRYNYGKTSWNIPRQYIEKRERLRTVAAQFGADLRTAALQFSAAPAAKAHRTERAHADGGLIDQPVDRLFHTR